MDTATDSELSNLRLLLLQTQNVRVDDTALNSSIYQALSNILSSLQQFDTNKSKEMSVYTISATNLQLLEDVCVGKNTSFIKSFQAPLLSIYSKIIEISSGYIVRSILNSMIILSSGKVANNLSRDCAVSIIGIIMEAKFSDCGSQVNEAVQCLTKLCKATSDGALRSSIFKSITSIVIGGGTKISDLHQDIIKLATKFCTDKIPEVRFAVAVLIKNVVKSTSVSSIPTDMLLTPSIRGLEDEVASVQEAFATSLASIFIEQINSYTLTQEQAKYGMARGSVEASTSPNTKKTKSPRQSLSRLSILKLKELTSNTKKVVEDYEFKSVVGHIIKQIIKFTGAARSGYLFTLGYLIRECINQLDQDDFDWIVDNILSLLHDPVFSSLTYEECTYVRVRVSYLIRSAIASNISEVKLISFATQLCKFISGVDASNKTDSELQLALSELENVISSLGPAAIAIVDEVNVSSMLCLRHSSFAVRSAATYVLSSLSVIAPGVGAEMLRNALAQTKIQAKQLVQLDASESMTNFDISALDEGIQSSSPGDVLSTSVLKKKNPKEVERLQRMFYFHGNTLVISVVLKNMDRIPTGLPHSLILDIFDLGLELLQQDTTTTSMIVRHVSCSIVRAGSLIVSSCISLGGHIARCRLKILLQSCYKIFQIVNKTSNPLKNEELIYEIMSLEAALVCISTLILFCPQEVKNDETCLPVIVEGLEISLRALKGKYQPGFRTHFRFRTLHVILLECFSWLPFGSFPNSVQQVFVEALRVFRDCIAAEYECSCLSDLIAHDHKILRIGSFNSYQRLHSNISSIPSELLMDESSMVLKLEQYVVALQKKESEAFLAAFGKNNYTSATTEQSATYSQAVDMMSLSIASCAQIDSRTVDSSILLLASTFSLQSCEYQDKAIQLFCQAVLQFSKSTTKSLGLFSSDEEKKKKEWRMYLTIKNVSSILVAIVRLFPSQSIVSIDSDAVWFQSMIDLLFELLGSNLSNIRCSASVALALFIKKSRNPSVLQTICIKIRSFLMTSLIKKGESMADCSGYVLSLSSLWCGSKEVKDVRSVIMTTVFDCLRKQDCASSFKAYSFLSLSIITKDQLINYTPDSTADAVDLLDKIVQVIEISIANLTSSEDLDLFYICVLRLLNISIPFSLKIRYNESKTKKILQLWYQLQATPSSKSLLDESLYLFVNLIPNDIDAVYSKFIFKHLLSVAERRSEYSIESLSCAFENLEALVQKFPIEACEMGIPKALFEILDMCFSYFAKSSLSTYSGIEIKRGQLVEETQLCDLKKLELSITNALYSLIQADVKNRPDQRVSYWILFCRSVALNLRSSSKKNNSSNPEPSEEGDNDIGESFEDNNENITSDTKSTGNNSKNKTESTSDQMSIKVTNYQSLSIFMREYCTENVPEFEVSRIHIKYVAIKCVIVALSCIELDSTHFDLGRSRVRTNECISSLGVDVNLNNVFTMPIFVSLFLNDLINLSCATATYTINDKPILSLQIESMKLIKMIVELFSHTNDPDINQTDSINTERLLSQFISQILGAVRLGLSTSYSNELYMTSGSVVCSLIQFGFLTDKVVARRLIKSLLSFCENTDDNGSVNSISFNQLRKLLKTSANVSEEVSTCNHIFGSIITAKLLILSSFNNSNNNSIHESVKATIISSINEHKEILSSIWMSIAIDSVRISQSDLLYQQNLSNLSDAEISDMILSSNNIENHPNRGGFTYAPLIKLSKLKHHFDYALPFVIAAYSILPNTQSEPVHIFSLSCIVIRRYFNEMNDKQVGDISLSKSVNIISMTLSNISNLIKGGSFVTSNNLLLSQWDNILLFIVNNIKHTMNKIKASEFSSLLITTFDCFFALSNSLITPTQSSNIIEKKSISSFINRIWSLSMKVIVFLFPCLFDENIDANDNSLSFPTLVNITMLMDRNLKVTSTTYESLNKLIQCLFNLAQQREDFRNYTLSLYSSITFLISMNLPINQEISQCEPLNLIVSNSTILCRNFDILTSQQIASVLLDDLNLFIKSSALKQKSFDVVFDAIMKFWKSIIFNTATSRLIKSNNYRSMYNPPFAYQLNAIVMDTNEKVFVIKGVLNGIIKFIQDNISEAVGLLVIDTFASSFICRIISEPNEVNSFDKVLKSEMRSLLVKGIMLMFSVAVESKRAILIEVIIQPLCANMAKVRNEDPNYLLLCGKVLSHMARQSAEAFRIQVSKLIDADKNILQEVMIQAIQQSGSNYSRDASINVNNTNNSKAMKIDLAKYKK